MKKDPIVLCPHPRPLSQWARGELLKELFLYNKIILARELRKAATREEVIPESGDIYFIRVTNEEIKHDLNILLNKIKTYMETPSPVGEGRGEGFIL